MRTFIKKHSKWKKIDLIFLKRYNKLKSFYYKEKLSKCKHVKRIIATYASPLGFGKLPEGTQAIITLLEEVPKDIEESLREFDTITQAIEAGVSEEMPQSLSSYVK